jgi:hypothetical protein
VIPRALKIAFVAGLVAPLALSGVVDAADSQPRLILQITVDQLRGDLPATVLGRVGKGDIAIVNHGSPWRYDTFVPVVFAGHGLKGQRVNRPVETVDIAATLAAYMKIKPPSGSAGTPLYEVLGQ